MIPEIEGSKVRGYISKSMNFIPTNAPANPKEGDTYYDKNDKVLRIWTGSQWDNLNGTAVDNTNLSSSCIRTTRDLSLADGKFSVTGVGFQPTSVHASAYLDNTFTVSRGFADSSRLGNCTYSKSATYGGGANDLLVLLSDANNLSIIDLASYDADGATFSTTKVNSPTGIAYIALIFYR